MVRTSSFLLLACAVILGLAMLGPGLTENNDYSLEGLEETIRTVQAPTLTPTSTAQTSLEECYNLCDFAFEVFSEIHLECEAQCKGLE